MEAIKTISAQLAQSIKPKSLPLAVKVYLIAIVAGAATGCISALAYREVKKFASHQRDELAKQLVVSFTQTGTETAAKQFLTEHQNKIKELGIAQNFLHLAIDYHPQTDELLKILVQCGANVTGTIPDTYGYTILRWACEKNSLKNVSFILDQLPTNDKTRPNSAEWRAAASHQIAILERFLEKADKSCCDKIVLTTAARDAEKVKLLAEKAPGCRTPKNGQEETPLAHMARVGYLDSIKELLQYDDCQAQKRAGTYCSRSKKIAP